MASYVLSGIKNQQWTTRRAPNLGAVAGTVSKLILEPDTTVRTVLVASEGVAIRISSWDLADGSVMPADCYFVLPANNAVRIPVVSDEAGRVTQVICIAGDDVNAPCSWAVEYGDFTSQQATNL